MSDEPKMTLIRGRGRRKQAEVLTAMDFIAALRPLTGSSKESDVIEYANTCTDAHLRGIISGAQLDMLQRTAALVLRAIRQRAARSDVEELEAMLAKLEDAEDRAGERGAAERGRTR